MCKLGSTVLKFIKKMIRSNVVIFKKILPKKDENTSRKKCFYVKYIVKKYFNFLTKNIKKSIG